MDSSSVASTASCIGYGWGATKFRQAARDLIDDQHKDVLRGNHGTSIGSIIGSAANLLSR
jgi:hypothetical protein